MRKKQHTSNAEKQKAYRERKRNDNSDVTTIDAIAKAYGISTSLMRLAQKVRKADASYVPRIMTGEITLHKAALELGIIKPRASISTTNIDQAIDVLLEHYTSDQILAGLVDRNAFDHWDEENEYV